MMDIPKLPLQSIDIIIMLIDDQAITGKLIQKILLNHEDINFHYCSNPLIALNEIESVSPTVILLDLFMPEINGIDLLKSLRKNPISVDIPIIMLSTEDDATTKGQAFENGANDYMVKLPDKVEFIARLRYHSQAYIHKLQRDRIFSELKKTQIELEKQNVELLRLSQIDGMTEIANRRYFDETIVLELKRAVRNKTPLSLIMVDVDHFKLYNDTYGHLKGDDCLKKVAETIRKEAKRPADLVARYGGEEFVLLLPETDTLGAVRVAENIRTKINALKLPHSSSLTAEHVTLSMGVFCCIPTFSDTPEILLKQADAQLYNAKQSGRNQIKFSDKE